jgi:hypothetical protein
MLWQTEIRVLAIAAYRSTGTRLARYQRCGLALLLPRAQDLVRAIHVTTTLSNILDQVTFSGCGHISNPKSRGKYSRCNCDWQIALPILMAHSTER